MDFDDFEVEELLQAKPMDTWGISYDLFTRRLEAEAPDGWHIYRGQLAPYDYHEIHLRRLTAKYSQRRCTSV